MVSQLYREDGLFYNYSEFLRRYNVPITPKEFSIVFDAIPSGLSMLHRCSHSAPLQVTPPDVLHSSLGNVCFSSHKSINTKIRSLFQDAMVSVPSAIFYWANFVTDIEWKKVWTLPQRFFLTNKIKEISFKLIHKFYPTKQYLSKFMAEINVNCTFCQEQPETVSHLFWSCKFTCKFWKDFHKFITDFVLPNLQLYYKDVIFGYYNFKDKDNDAFFFINLVLFLAKFHIHKSKVLGRKPELLVLKMELAQYIRTISSSKNTKALKTVNIYNRLKLLT